MLTIRWDFPHLSPRRYSEDRFDPEDHQFHREILDIVKVRATRKQLGQKFDGYQFVMDGDDRLAEIQFHFLGGNNHGAYHTVSPFMRDLVVELRAKRGVETEVRPKDMLGEL
jgi:hypothetical protein